MRYVLAGMARSHAPVDQPRVEPHVQVRRQLTALTQRSARETHRSFGQTAVAPPQDDVHEAFAQTR